MIVKIIKILFMQFLLVAQIFSQNHLWEKTDGPYGGIINSIQMQNDTLYISGNSGVYRSTNLGVDWVPIGLHSFGVTSLSIGANYLIAISSGGCFRLQFGESEWVKIKNGRYQSLSAKGSLVYLGSDYEGVFRSKDSGQNWEKINNGIDNYDINKIHITESNIVLASAAGASGSGVFRSTDFGDTWTRIDPYQFAWNFQGITEVNSVLYAFDFNNYAKVYKSIDDGLTWYLPRNSHAPSDIINSIYADNSNLYVGVYHYGLFKSNDEGATWSKINSGLKNFTIIDIKGNPSTLFLATFDGFYKSEKTTMRWKKLMSKISGTEVFAIAQNSKYLFVGSYGSGLFRRRKDTNSWSELNLSLNYKFVASILALDNVIFVLASSWTGNSYQDLFISYNNGLSWNRKFSGELETIVGNNNVLFIGSGDGVFRSTNTGNNWVKMTNGLPDNINSSSIAVHDSIVIVTNGTSGIYRSENSGASWSYNIVPELFSGMAVSASSEGIFYLGSGSVNYLFKSEDSGATWRKLNNPLYNSSVNSIGISGTNIYCGLSHNGIIKSTDRGETWTESNLGLSRKNVYNVSIENNYVFAGTNGGLFQEISSNINPIVDYPSVLQQNNVVLSWNMTPRISTYRIQVSIDSLFQSILVDQIIEDTSFSLQSLDFSTIYYWRVSTVTEYWDDYFSSAQIILVSNPNNYELHNNYPNPFNNETNIRIDIPIKSEINLILYNLLGEKIVTLENNIKNAGSYHYKLNSKGLASGVYLLRLVGKSYSKTIKLILLR